MDKKKKQVKFPSVSSISHCINTKIFLTKRQSIKHITAIMISRSEKNLKTHTIVVVE